MKHAKILFLSFVCFVLAGNALPSPSQDSLARLFAQGNSEYQKGNYASAEHYYSRILNSGADGGAIYYNLGNACFKQKRIGDAIYYWEKAQQKLPADQEIKENLDLANLLIVDRIEIPADPLPVRILASVPGLLTISQESWLILMLFVSANALFSMYLLVKNPRFSFRALIGCFFTVLLLVAVGCSLGWKIYDRAYRKQGVVIEQKADVRSGPGPENTTVFTIHEGIKVRVRGSSNDWFQVSLPNGWNGWLPQDSIRIL